MAEDFDFHARLSRWARHDPRLPDVLRKCRDKTCDAEYRAGWTSVNVETADANEATPPASTSATFQRSHASDAANAAVSRGAPRG